MAKLKDITPTQYAVYKGCTLANCTKHLRKRTPSFIDEIVNIVMHSRFYILQVNESMDVLSLDKCTEILSKKRKAKAH